MEEGSGRKRGQFDNVSKKLESDYSDGKLLWCTGVRSSRSVLWYNCS